MGAQFGSKRQPDKARRELEGPNVVPRKQKEHQKGAKVPSRILIWRLLHPFWSENVIQMAAMRGKNKKSEIRKTIEKTMVFQ